MTTPLPHRLRESAKVLRALHGIVTVSDRIAAELEQAADALEAGPPDGFVLVPKVPTDCMHAAFRFSYESPGNPLLGGRSRLDFPAGYAAMLAAAPAAQVAQEGGGVATDGALSPHAAALTVDTVLERLDFMAGHEASAILRDTAEAAAAMIRAARGVTVALRVEDIGNGWKRQTSLTDAVKGGGNG